MPSRMCSRMGLPSTLSIGLGSSLVSSRMRVPLPAARMTAFTRPHLWESPRLQAILFGGSVEGWKREGESPVEAREERRYSTGVLIGCLESVSLSPDMISWNTQVEYLRSSASRDVRP